MARVVRMDLDGACELVSDDVEYDNVPMGKVVRPGRDQERARPDGRHARRGRLGRSTARSPADSLVLNERTDRFGMNGKWMELPVAGVFEVHDDRITLWRDYFDMTTFTNQLTELAG